MAFRQPTGADSHAPDIRHRIPIRAGNLGSTAGDKQDNRAAFRYAGGLPGSHCAVPYCLWMNCRSMVVDTLLTFPLLLAVVTATLGLYLMLPIDHGLPEPIVHRVGACLSGLSWIFVGVFLTNGVAWWGDSRFDSPQSSATFAILAGCSIVLAVLTISARRHSLSAIWFFLMLLSNTGLFLFQGAYAVAVATVVIHAALMVAAYLLIVRWVERPALRRSDHHSREPLLACATGALLAVALTGAIHRAVTVEAQGQRESRTSAWPPHQILEAAAPNAVRPLQRDSAAAIGDLVAILAADYWPAIAIAGILLAFALTGSYRILRSDDQGHKSRDTFASTETPMETVEVAAKPQAAQES